MKLALLLSCVVLLVAPAASARVRLEVDLAQAHRVMETIESGRLGAEALQRFRADPVTREVVTHGAKFDARVTPEAWETGLAAAAAGKPLANDPLRFGELLSRREECAALLARLSAEKASMTARVEKMLSSYTPADLDLAVTMHVVAGSNSTGWTTGDGGRFYFDARAAGDDFEGMVTIVTHEIYHLVMARLLPAARLNEASLLGQIERMLLNGLDEGMATHVARFEGTGEGRLVRMNRRIAQINEIRAGANFTLFSALVATAARGEGVSAEDASLIAYSGAYDEFGYYLFRDMLHEVEKARGAPALMQLVRESPTALVLAYHSLPADPKRHRLTPAALRAIESVDKAAASTR